MSVQQFDLLLISYKCLQKNALVTLTYITEQGYLFVIDVLQLGAYRSPRHCVIMIIYPAHVSMVSNQRWSDHGQQTVYNSAWIARLYCMLAIL